MIYEEQVEGHYRRQANEQRKKKEEANRARKAENNRRRKFEQSLKNAREQKKHRIATARFINRYLNQQEIFRNRASQELANYLISNNRKQLLQKVYNKKREVDKQVNNLTKQFPELNRRSLVGKFNKLKPLVHYSNRKKAVARARNYFQNAHYFNINRYNQNFRNFLNFKMLTRPEIMKLYKNINPGKSYKLPQPSNIRGKYTPPNKLPGTNNNKKNLSSVKGIRSVFGRLLFTR